MTRTQYFIAINRAQLDGFTHFAQALIALYHRDYPKGGRK